MPIVSAKPASLGPFPAVREATVDLRRPKRMLEAPQRKGALWYKKPFITKEEGGASSPRLWSWQSSFLGLPGLETQARRVSAGQRPSRRKQSHQLRRLHQPQTNTSTKGGRAASCVSALSDVGFRTRPFCRDAPLNTLPDTCSSGPPNSTPTAKRI